MIDGGHFAGVCSEMSHSRTLFGSSATDSWRAMPSWAVAARSRSSGAGPAGPTLVPCLSSSTSVTSL